MTMASRILSTVFAAGLGLAVAGTALTEAYAGQTEGRGGNEGGGEGPFAAAGFKANRITDTGCYRPGDSLAIDWQGLTDFDGDLALVSDIDRAPLDVTSWTDRVVLARLGDAEPGRTYPVIWTSSDEVQAVIGELHTCSE